MKQDLALADKVVRLHRALERAKVPHAFGGALALAYYATPRATIDIDVNVFLTADQFEKLAAILTRIGVDTIPPASVAARDGQMRARWGRNPLDVFFSYDEVHEAMRAGIRVVPFGRTTIPILAPEHLLVAKAVFNRAKDWIDIEQMLVAVDELDSDEILAWLVHLVGGSDPRAERVATLITELRGTR